jgi:carbamate kinase
VLVADTEGGMGYMIEQSLQNRLKLEQIDRPVVTLITQMLVDEHDPAVTNPSKFIGQFYTEEESKIFSHTRGWHMKKDGDRGWRRVVASPKPLKAVNGEVIRRLVDSGVVVVASGGGGIPVFVDQRGLLEGMDAVIDKDLGSAVLGREIGAEVLCILTSVDKVAINFGKPNQRELDVCRLSEIRKHREEKHFPAGSMGPKIDAAIEFLSTGGRMVTISSFANARRALVGEAGTRIVPD